MTLTSNDLDDIKQLLDAALTGQEERIMSAVNKRFDEVDERFDDLEERMDERFNEVLDAVGKRFYENEEHIDDHEARIVRLEEKAA